jgi:hypothetical protein
MKGVMSRLDNWILLGGISRATLVCGQLVPARYGTLAFESHGASNVCRKDETDLIC